MIITLKDLPICPVTLIGFGGGTPCKLPLMKYFVLGNEKFDDKV